MAKIRHPRQRAVEAFIANVQGVVQRHCDPGNPAGFLDQKGRYAAVRGLALYSNAVRDALRPLIGEQETNALVGTVLQRLRRMLGWADPETCGDLTPAGKQKDYLLVTLRREYDTTDLPVYYTRMREAASAAPMGAPTGFGDVPALDTESGEWIKSREAARRENVTMDSLKTYRNNGNTSADGLRGTDPQGRIWAKRNRNAHVWYVKSSLRHPSQP